MEKLSFSKEQTETNILQITYLQVGAIRINNWYITRI